MRILPFLALLICFSAQAAPQFVQNREKVPAGTIVIHTESFALYLVLDSQRAIRYPVAAPKLGHDWTGTAHISGKFLRPAWSPPDVVRHDHPELPNVIPGGDPSNPMGAAAMLLDRDQYAIHGTSATARKSIGTHASYGCIRMYNEDIMDLFQRVHVGTLVVKVP